MCSLLEEQGDMLGPSGDSPQVDPEFPSVRDISAANQSFEIFVGRYTIS